MGCQLQPNHGFLIGAIVHLLDVIKEDAQEQTRLETWFEETGLKIRPDVFCHNTVNE